MSDPSRATLGVTTQPADTAVPAGDQLRAAREAVGLTLDDLSIMLKVSVSKLEALEANRLDLLQDVAFTRALAASVCRILKIDTAPVLARLPTASGTSILPETTVGQGVSVRSQGAWSAVTSQLPKSVLTGVLVLVLGIVAMLLWPRPDATHADPSATEDLPVGQDITGQEMAGSVGGSPEETQMQTETELARPTAQSASLADSVPVPTSSVPSSATMPVRTSIPASIPTSVLTTASAQAPLSVQTASASSNVFGVYASGPSWVEVSDARGATLLRRMVTEGEHLEVSGTWPLSVVVGRSDVVKLTVRGRPFDFSEWSTNNVARFQVQ